MKVVTKGLHPDPHRSARGKIAYSSGAMAEENVAERYAEMGYILRERRWRSKAGEIDLIFEKQGEFVFAEVKSAESHDAAAARISRRQMDRICQAACDYVGRLATGLLTEMRFDAALVDGFGRVDILENAFGQN